MYTKKFAVMNVIGNDEIILRTFAPEEKEQAIACGTEVIKRDFNGVMSAPLSGWTRTATRPAIRRRCSACGARRSGKWCDVCGAGG